MNEYPKESSDKALTEAPAEAESPWFTPANPELIPGDLEVDEEFAAAVMTSMWFVSNNSSAPRIPRPRDPSPGS